MNRSVVIISYLLVALIVACVPKNGKKNADPKVFIGPTLVIHGGAGMLKPENLDSTRKANYLMALNQALDTGYTILENGGTSMDAIEAAIFFMERSPLFNAGVGAVLTHEGRAELDASVMNGATGMAGAVAGVRTIRSPIRAARQVMEHSDHVMLSGRGAEDFALSQGLKLVPPEHFILPKRRAQLERIILQEQKTQEKGTVGAVAMDLDGNIAAGTSTGGMMNKRWGRIGDSPVIGAGTYAENGICGVSATGHGEYFIRNVVAYDLAARVKYAGVSLREAAEEVVMNRLKGQGGNGGIIAIDGSGNPVMVFNTSCMFRGSRIAGGENKVAIFNDSLSN